MRFSKGQHLTYSMVKNLRTICRQQLQKALRDFILFDHFFRSGQTTLKKDDTDVGWLGGGGGGPFNFRLC